MDTDPDAGPHYGRCGIHIFDDPERARKPCDICAEIKSSIHSGPTIVKRPSHKRAATDTQKAWFSSAIKLAAERNKERGGKLP